MLALTGFFQGREAGVDSIARVHEIDIEGSREGLSGRESTRKMALPSWKHASDQGSDNTLTACGLRTRL
jgi:hypothetical protein